MDSTGNVEATAVATGDAVPTGTAVAVEVEVDDSEGVWTLGDGASLGDARAVGSTDATGRARACVARAVGTSDATGTGSDVSIGSSLGASDTRSACVCVRSGIGRSDGAGVTRAIVASGLGVGDATTATEPSSCRPASESPAPMTNPSTITPMRIGTIGNDARSEVGRRGRRGGVVDIDVAFRLEMNASLATRIDAR